MTFGDAPRGLKWAPALIWSLAACLLVIVLLIGTFLYRNVAQPPPFNFTASVYPPTRGDICPGDTVQWRSQLVVTRAPTMLFVARTLWSVSTNATVQPDATPQVFLWTEAERGRSIPRPLSYRLPADLPVGLYEIRVGAASFSSDAAVYRVPFVIAESCARRGAVK